MRKGFGLGRIAAMAMAAAGVVAPQPAVAQTTVQAQAQKDKAAAMDQTQASPIAKREHRGSVGSTGDGGGFIQVRNTTIPCPQWVYGRGSNGDHGRQSSRGSWRTK